MRSPISLLENQINSAPLNIAPEKADLCAQYINENNITIALVDEPGFGIRVRLCANTQMPEIVLPVASLEYLWAFSHYCWVLVQEYSSAQDTDATYFDCVGSSRLRSSYAVLNWAKMNLAGSGTASWPSECPRPKQDDHGCGDTHVATELFLCAVAWILHHEIAHVVLRHPLIGTTLATEEERQADRHATKWLLEGLLPDAPESKKRVIGITVALLCLQSLEVGVRSCLRSTHPAAHDRIFDNLDGCQDWSNETAAAFSSVVLQYLFCDEGVMANAEGYSFSEIYRDLLFDISRSMDNR
jgi:hypothetical protein